jgi:rhamnose utilization protein RhaD (predicted bifunctional aldolase and dehydrogenase)
MAVATGRGVEKTTMDLLKQIVDISHEFGAPEYVTGGGGNTSAKNAETVCRMINSIRDGDAAFMLQNPR